MAGRRWLRVSLVVLGVFLVLVVGTLALLPSLLDTSVFHAYVSQAAGQAVGRPVKFDSLSVSLLPLPNVKLQGLEIADDPHFGKSPLLQVGDVRVGVGLRAAEMPIKGSLSLEGEDIAPLARAFLFASPALSGPVKGKLEVSGTAARPGATGQIAR